MNRRKQRRFQEADVHNPYNVKSLYVLLNEVKEKNIPANKSIKQKISILKAASGARPCGVFSLNL